MPLAQCVHAIVLSERLELVKQDNYYAYASLAALFYQVAALIRDLMDHSSINLDIFIMIFSSSGVSIIKLIVLHACM